MTPGVVAPTRPRLRAGGVVAVLLVALLPRAEPAAEEWVLARSPSFVVVSDAGEKRVRQVARQFEVLRELFRSVLEARVDPARPLVVLAVKDETGLRRLLPRQFAVKGGVRPAGIFVPGGDIHHIALRLDIEGDHRYHVIYHEYTHLLVRLNFHDAPLWLNEGLAEFYAGTDVDDDEARFGRLLPWHVRVLRSQTMLSLQKLMAVDWSSPEYNEAHRVSVFYAQAAAFTHYLLLGDRDAHRPALAKYFSLLREGTAEAEAQQRAFGDIEKLDRDFDRYVRGFQFMMLKVPLKADPRATVVRSLTEAEALAVQGQFLVHSGNLAEALAASDEALRRDPSLTTAHEVRGWVFAAQGRTTEALAEFKRAAEGGGRSFITHYRLGTLAAASDAADRGRRESSLRTALELQPGYAPAHSALAALLELKGSAEEAVEQARIALALEPGEPAHALRLASAQRAAGRKAEAEAIEEGLVRAANADPRLLSQVAWFFRESGRPGEAEALVRRVRAARPGLLGVTMVLARMLRDQKRYDEAEALFREVLAARPEDASLLNSLGYMNAERNVRVPEALQLIEKALRKRPDDPNILDSRAWACFRLGRLADAERDLRRALEQTTSLEMLDHLADVLAAKGAREEAVTTWRRALEQAGGDEDRRRQIEAKLARQQPATVP